MTIHNSEIAALFNRLADLLEIANENPYRIRAYRNAAITVSSLSRNIEEMLRKHNNLTEFPGIGKDLAEKIVTIVNTGELPLLKEIEKTMPPILCELLKIEGLGPKRVQTLYTNLKVQSIADLKKIIAKGELRKLKNFGEKTEIKILASIQHIKEYGQRIKLADAVSIVDSLLSYMKRCKEVQKIECCGSYRRRKETVGDLDLIASARYTKKVIDHFIQFDEISKIISQGETRSSVRLHSGINVDLRVVTPNSYGAAIVYFTGSKAHNITMRKIALKNKLKLNEYGVFKGKRSIAVKTEADIYNSLGLPCIPPELRENNGEIAAAKDNKLPTLIELNHIKGDLHCHTHATDGTASIEAMANKAKQLGYDYFAISDHSKHLAMVFGFDEKMLLKQIKQIDRINERLTGITILKSIEVDILENGKLDLSDSILKELDFTVCAIHSKFHLSKKQQTERLLHAMDNPYFNILAHPTGRLINERPPYEIDVEKVLVAAKEKHCFVEVNAQPNRLDLNDIYCRLAKELQLKVVISTDAHSISQMDLMQFGVYQARRGWLEKSDVLNTLSLNSLKKAFKK